MKTKHLYLLSVCFLAVVVFILTAPAKTQLRNNDTGASMWNNDSDNFLLMPLDSVYPDFVVKYKGEIYSLRKLFKILRRHNITVPQGERAFLDEVLTQKQSPSQSCEGRCFMKERSKAKWCYCDVACKTWGDCCLDFYLRCSKTGIVSGDASLRKMTCGDVNDPLWTGGVIMKSSCSLPLNNPNTNECQTVQRLNMTIKKEMPVFDWNNNITYRSVACARCNNGGNLSYWGLKIEYLFDLQPPQHDISAIKRFLKKNGKSSWQYAPFPKFQYRFKSCVVQDSVCASNQLPVMSVIRDLCSAYSMPVSNAGYASSVCSYRNPHCALCNPNGGGKRNKGHPGHGENPGSSVPSLSILFDMSANVLYEKAPETAQPPTQIYNRYNLSTQLSNCNSTIKSCTVIFGGKACVLLSSLMNNTAKMFLNTSHVKVLTPKQLLLDTSAMKPKENAVVLLCPNHQNLIYKQQGFSGFSVVPSYITFIGTILSIISLLFLLGVYLFFKELRNLPGKCLISLSCALLCYQVIFLFVEQSKEVEALCKAVALCLHFFVLSSFSWMSVMAFDTANTFKVQLRKREIQASHTRKTFIKYCIVGWGVPAVAVVGSAVLDSTGIFHFGYGNIFYCWISDSRAIAVAMVTPVSLALVFNAMCLTKNLYSIHHLQQGAKLAATKTSRVPFLVICIKLTAVMGLTWILALIANWQQIAFLQYPSAVLNSMQGFFIMLCFTTTKRVRSLLREKVCKRCNHAESKTSVTHCKGSAYTQVATGSSSFNMTTQSKHGNQAGQHTP